MKNVHATAICTLALLLVSGCGSNSDNTSDPSATDGQVDSGADETPPSGDPPDGGTDGPVGDDPADGTDGDSGAPPDGDGTDPSDGPATDAGGPVDDAPGDDGSGTTDDEPSDAGSTDGDPVDDDTSGTDPSGDGPADNDPNGDGGDGTDGDADQGGDDAAAPDLINADNYVSLTEFAVRMNIIILADRSLSPTVFLKRFPPDFGPLFEAALERFESSLDTSDPSFDPTVNIAETCPLGGRYEASVGAFPPSSFFRATYDDCKTERGTLSGEYSESSYPREQFEEYDLAYTVDDGPNGPGTTVFEAAYERGEFANVGFDIGRYSRDTPRDPFSVSGSGDSRFDIWSAENEQVYDVRTTIWFESDDGRSIDLDVSVKQLVLADGRPRGGALSLEAQDGSRVDVGVSEDVSHTVWLTRTDRAGETFTDTVAWSEIYKPPE